MPRKPSQKGAELAGILHDLAAPLTAARGWAELLVEAKLGKGPEKWAARLSDCLKEMAHIVVSACPSEVFCPTEDLESLLSSMELRAVETGTWLLCTGPERGPWRVRGAREAFRRIAWNLLSNALRHAPGGCVEAEVTLRRGARGWRLRLEVRDEGPGLGKGAANALFRAGERGRDSAGSGLGLHVVRELARANGGEAGAIGAARGARFWAEMLVSEGVGREPERRIRGPVILVGGGPRLRRWVARMLTRWRIPCAEVSARGTPAELAEAAEALGGNVWVMAGGPRRGELPRGAAGWIDLAAARPCGPESLARLLGEATERLAKRGGTSSVVAPDAENQGQAPA